MVSGRFEWRAFIHGFRGTALLKKYDPATSQSVVVKEFDATTYIEIIRSKDVVIFSVERDDTTDLWRSDGTESGTFKFSTLPIAGNIYRRSDNGNAYSYFCHRSFRTPLQTSIWRTDGTDAGTVKVIDSGESNDLMIYSVSVIGSDAYVGLKRNQSGNESWKSDGTVAGTIKLTNTAGGSDENTTIKIGSKVFFSAGYRLYVSDGTAAGTQIVDNANITNATEYNGDYYFTRFAVGPEYTLGRSDGASIEYLEDIGTNVFLHSKIGNKLLISFDVEGKGRELGITDGTKEGTALLKDINPGPGSSEVRNVVAVGNKVIFTADDGVHGRELWITDGTEQGTKFVFDTAPGTGDGITDRGYVVKGVGTNQYLFRAQKEDNAGGLWITDGTEANTTELYSGVYPPEYLGSINSVPYFSRTNGVQTVKSNGEVEIVNEQSNFVTYALNGNGESNGKLFFQGYTISTGEELWVTDGTEGGTHIVKDINPGDARAIGGSFSAPAFNKLIFNADDGMHGNELWISDGTEEGTHLLYDLNPGSGGSISGIFLNFKQRIFFSVYINSERTLWSTDGTTEGTHIEFELPSYVWPSTVLNNRILFVVNEIGVRSEIWTSDGTSEGTKVLKSFKVPANSNDQISTITIVSDRAFFFATDEAKGRELWVTDGTEAGTRLIDLTPGSASSDLGSVYGAINGLFYFSKSGDIWRSAGTLQTTEKVMDGEGTKLFTAIGQTIFLDQVTEQYGREIYTMPFEKMGQDIIFETLDDQPVGTNNVTLEATATSGLAIEFSASPIGRVSIDGDKINFLVPGKVTITASQSGNNGIAAADESQEICINPAAPEISVVSSGATVVLESSATSGHQWYNGETIITGATGKTYEATESGNYFVATSVEGCASISIGGKLVELITGLEDEKNFSMYPNPAKDKLFIDWKGYSGSAAVIDLRGNSLINSSFVNKTELSTSHLSADFYVIKITSGDKQIIRKFVKE